MPTTIPLCGDLLAVTVAAGEAGPVRPGETPFGPDGFSVAFDTGQVWGRGHAGSPVAPSAHMVIGLSLGIRHQDGAALGYDSLRQRLRTGVGLDEVAAPFAAAVVEPDGVWVAADHLGLRHLYSVRGRGWAAVSTNATLLARLAGSSIDEYAWSTYRFTSHFVGLATAYTGVTKLAPAHRWRLAGGELTTVAFTPSPDQLAGTAWTAPASADLLRHLAELYLDHWPQPCLELSGGMDSRLILSAVRPARRGELRTLTLTAEGSDDGVVAAEIAELSGLKHQEVDMAGLAAVDPADAHARIMDVAARHHAGGNPVNLAALAWVEEQVEPGVQITGQAGEMMRGIYFLEPRSETVKPEHVRRFVRLWFTNNEAVPAEVLSPEFAASSPDALMEQFQARFDSYQTDWRTARDQFLLERVHRWGGVNYTGGCLDRIVASPFFDPRYLRMCAALPPEVKRGSGFAARVLEVLDPQLAELPLASGLRPSQFPRLLAGYKASYVARSVVRKAVQKVRHTNRPPVGAAALAQQVVKYWRAHPESLDAAARCGLVNPEWLDGMLKGLNGAGPSTVGYLANLQMMASALRPSAPGPSTMDSGSSPVDSRHSPVDSRHSPVDSAESPVDDRPTELR